MNGNFIRKLAMGLGVAVAVLALVVVFYVFQQKSVTVGQYTVLYYKNMSGLDAGSFPQDLESLKHISGLIRITWTAQTAADMFQEYCYLPGKGVEKTRLIHKIK